MKLVVSLSFSVLVGILSPACHPTRTIAGFPNRTLAGYGDQSCRDIADTIEKHVRHVRAGIDNADRTTNLERQALHSIFDALLVLANDQPDFRLISSEYENYIVKQVLPPTTRPPLCLYPRITHPHITETKALDRTADTSVNNAIRRSWFIPLILSRRALALDPPTRFDAFWERLGEVFGGPVSPDPAPALRVIQSLSFWLEPRDGMRTSWIALPDPVFRPDVVIRKEQAPKMEHDVTGDFHLSLPDSSAVGLAFAIDASDDAPPPGFYNVQILPRLPELAHDELETGFGRALTRGDWHGARARLRLDQARSPAALARDLGLVHRATYTWTRDRFTARHVRYWREELERFACTCATLRHDLKCPSTAGRRAQFVREVEDSIGDLLAVNDSPAPVYLDGADENAPFSFLVAADLQFHEGEPAVDRFLECVNGPCHGTMDGLSLPQDVRDDIRNAKFVLLAGDLADAAAGNAPQILVANVLGLFPPVSPYTGTPYSGLREHIELRQLLDELHKPVFAVPGNHDGTVGYGGILSFPLDSLAELLNEFHPLRPGVARAVFTLNDFIPNGIKLHVPTTGTMIPRQSRLGQCVTPPQGDGFLSWFFAPRYDGLAEWRWHLGPLNVAFRYRGFTFVGLNSFNLSQPDRAGVGAVVDNWGGGVRAQDVGWLLAMVECPEGQQRSFGYGTCESARPSFLFMHHDPRGVTPAASTLSRTVPNPHNLTEPEYDAPDAWGSYLTMGYVGLGYSPAWGLFIPLVTPLGELARQAVSNPNRFTQEWMQGYGGRELSNAIGRTLTTNGCAHSLVFFGHNDTPRPWHASQCADPWGLPEPNGETCSRLNSPAARLASLFFKVRSTHSVPGQVRPGRQQEAPGVGVVRVDDVGNQGSPHGFVVVRVDPARDEVEVVPIDLPSGPPMVGDRTETNMPGGDAEGQTTSN